MFASSPLLVHGSYTHGFPQIDHHASYMLSTSYHSPLHTLLHSGVYPIGNARLSVSILLKLGSYSNVGAGTGIPSLLPADHLILCVTVNSPVPGEHLENRAILSHPKASYFKRFLVNKS